MRVRCASTVLLSPFIYYCHNLGSPIWLSHDPLYAETAIKSLILLSCVSHLHCLYHQCVHSCIKMSFSEPGWMYIQSPSGHVLEAPESDKLTLTIQESM